MRFYYLDHLRFFSAISVLLYHFFYKGIIGNKITANFEPIEYLKFGYLGVDCFFIISGFVIFNSYGKHSFLKFIFLRFRSIYPTFVVCMSLTVILGLYAGNDYSVYQILLNLSFLPEVFGYSWVDGVYWTLFFEVFFYTITSIFIGLRLNVSMVMYLLAFWVLLYAVSLVLGGDGFLFSGYFLHFIFGAYTSYFVSANFSLISPIRKYFFKFFYLFITAMSIHFVFKNATNLAVIEGFDSYISCVVFLMFLMFFYFAVYFARNNNSPTVFIKSLGRSSYFLYLIHAGIGYSLLKFFQPATYVILTGLAIAAVISSFLLARYVEEFYLRFFDRFKPL